MVLRCPLKRRAFQSARAEALERRTLFSVSLLSSTLQGGEAPTQLGGRLVYWAWSQSDLSFDAWVSDGTAAGTMPVAPAGRIPPMGDPVVASGRIYFATSDSTHGVELWVTDATAAGTHLVKDIFPGPSPSYPYNLINFHGVLYFEAADAAQNVRIWRTDGTDPGTVPVTGTVTEGNLIVAGNNLFLDTHTSLFLVNASGGLDDLGPGTFPIVAPRTNAAGLGGDLYYFRSQLVNGVRHPQMWRSDGTLAGTALVADLVGETFSDGTNLTVIGGRLVFTFGSDLFASDGTTARTHIVANIGAGYITSLNGYAIFLPTDSSHSGIWRTDGTAAGTYMVTGNGPPVGPEDDPFNSATFFIAGGLAFYRRINSAGAVDLWETDGTPGGTSMVANIGNVSRSGGVMGVAANYLLFTSPDGIWRVDLLAGVSGSVFNDANHNGASDAGEVGLAGVTVYDDANNNGVLDPGEIRATTNSAGAYTLLNVPATQAAMIRQVAPTGWRRTAPLAASTAVPLITGETASGPVFGDVRISTVPIDFAYLLTIGQNFGRSGTFATGDLTGDGRVDFDDLLLAAQSYGRPLPSAATGVGIYT